VKPYPSPLIEWAICALLWAQIALFARHPMNLILAALFTSFALCCSALAVSGKRVNRSRVAVGFAVVFVLALALLWRAYR